MRLLVLAVCSSEAPHVPHVCKHLADDVCPQPFTRCPHDCTTLLLCRCREGCCRQPVAVKCALCGDAAVVAKQQARFQRQAAASAAAAAITAARVAAAVNPAAAGCGVVYCCPHLVVQQQRAIDQRRTAVMQKRTLLCS